MSFARSWFPQSPSSLLPVIKWLSLFPRSSTFYYILEWSSHTTDVNLFVYDLGSLTGLPLCSSLTSLKISNAAFLSLISKINEVIGFGTTIHVFVDTKGQFVYLHQVDYHLPWSEICPFCPQVFHQDWRGNCFIFGGHGDVLSQSESNWCCCVQ